MSHEGESRWTTSQDIEAQLLGHELRGQLATREDDILKYEKGTQPSLPDDIEISVLMNETQGALQDNHRLNVTSLKKHSDLNRVIMNYFRSRQMSQRSASSGEGPMEVMPFGKAVKERTTGKEAECKGKGNKG